MCVRSSSGHSRGGKGNIFGTDGPTASSGSAKGEIVIADGYLNGQMWRSRGE